MPRYLRLQWSTALLSPQPRVQRHCLQTMKERGMLKRVLGMNTEISLTIVEQRSTVATTESKTPLLTNCKRTRNCRASDSEGLTRCVECHCLKLAYLFITTQDTKLHSVIHWYCQRAGILLSLAAMWTWDWDTLQCIWNLAFNYMYMFHAFYGSTQSTECATQSGNSQNARQSIEWRAFCRMHKHIVRIL